MAKKVFIPILKTDKPEHVKAATRVLGGKIKTVVDTKTGQKCKAIVYDG